MSSCVTCGARLVLEPRLRIEVCETCKRGPLVCVCQPVKAEPEWLRRAHASRYGLARPLEGWRAA